MAPPTWTRRRRTTSSSCSSNEKCLQCLHATATTDRTNPTQPTLPPPSSQAKTSSRRTPNQCLNYSQSEPSSAVSLSSLLPCFYLMLLFSTQKVFSLFIHHIFRWKMTAFFRVVFGFLKSCGYHRHIPVFVIKKHFCSERPPMFSKYYYPPRYSAFFNLDVTLRVIHVIGKNLFSLS